eukprot:6176306-Pleurochrysis_carterae.AAC.1
MADDGWIWRRHAVYPPDMDFLFARVISTYCATHGAVLFTYLRSRNRCACYLNLAHISTYSHRSKRAVVTPATSSATSSPRPPPEHFQRSLSSYPSRSRQSAALPVTMA